MLSSPRAAGAPAPSVTSADFVATLLHLGEPAMACRPALADRSGGRWREVTYAELDRRSAVVAAWLAGEGVAAGDRVALLAEPSCDWVIAFFGILRAGAVVVPLDARMTPGELGPRWRLVAPVAVVCAPPLAGLVRAEGYAAATPVLVLGGSPAGGSATGSDDLLGAPAPASRRSPAVPAATTGPGTAPSHAARRASDPALVVFTAGTTASPKGVTLSFANVAYVVDQAVRAHHPGPDDVWLSVLPLSHMLELACGLLPALAGGGCFSIAGTLMPHEVTAALRDRGATRMVAVPLVLRMLRRHLEGAGAPAEAGAGRGPEGRRRRRERSGDPLRHELGALDAVYCGGAALDPELAGFFLDLGVTVYQGYGLTEMSPIVSMSRPGRNRLGSVGPPLPGTEVRILGAPGPGGEGEVLVRGPGLMAGYWGDEAQTAAVVDADGWLHTGDVGYLDGHGFLYLTGRSRDLVVLQSGKKVQPEEVEAVLDASPLVREACVLGMPAADGYGQEVWAVVVPADVAGGVTSGSEAVEDEVRRVAGTLSGYKRPTHVIVHPGPLPRTQKGSLRRDEVRAMLAGLDERGR